MSAEASAENNRAMFFLRTMRRAGVIYYLYFLGLLALVLPERIEATGVFHQIEIFMETIFPAIKVLSLYSFSPGCAIMYGTLAGMYTLIYCSVAIGLFVMSYFKDFCPILERFRDGSYLDATKITRKVINNFIILGIFIFLFYILPYFVPPLTPWFPPAGFFNGANLVNVLHIQGLPGLTIEFAYRSKFGLMTYYMIFFGTFQIVFYYGIFEFIVVRCKKAGRLSEICPYQDHDVVE